MPTLEQAKGRARDTVIRAMRACIATDHVPMFAKKTFVNRCTSLLTALGIDSDEAPVMSEQGIKFSTGPHPSIVTSWLRFRGTYEPALSNFILRHVKAGDMCVDIGANIGYFSLLLAQCVGPNGKVIAVEASPSNVRRLRSNLELNEATDNVEVVAAACAAEGGEITFYEHPHVDGWSRLNPPAKDDPDRRHMGSTWIPVTVAAETLISIVGGNAEQVSFMKVDVEGAESALTPEIANSFPHPNLIVALEVRAQIEVTLAPFREQGFLVYDLHNDYRWLYERKVPAISEVSYRDLYGRTSADLLLSRRPLSLP
jgi:FkbM family methyltransferase